jgi:hypothetical protein
VKCTDCSTKMGCKFSIPIGNRLRFRHYKCPSCGWRMDSVEMPIEVFHDTAKHTTVNEHLKVGKVRHLSGCRRAA